MFGCLFVCVCLFVCLFVSFFSDVGGVSMVCVDPLQATGTVTTTVPFVIEVCGGDDFEVNDYGGPFFVPQFNGGIYTQSGGVVKSVSKDPSPLTMGEKLNSVKQIIQVPWWGKYTLTANQSVSTPIAPWFANLVYNSLLSASIPNASAVTLVGAGNPANMWAKCYAYAKGGTDIHVYRSAGRVERWVQQCTGFFRTLSGANTNYNSQPLWSGTPRIVTDLDSPSHVRIPAYQLILQKFLQLVVYIKIKQICMCVCTEA